MPDGSERTTSSTSKASIARCTKYLFTSSPCPSSSAMTPREISSSISDSQTSPPPRTTLSTSTTPRCPPRQTHFGLHLGDNPQPMPSNPIRTAASRLPPHDPNLPCLIPDPLRLHKEVSLVSKNQKSRQSTRLFPNLVRTKLSPRSSSAYVIPKTGTTPIHQPAVNAPAAAVTTNRKPLHRHDNITSAKLKDID